MSQVNVNPPSTTPSGDGFSAGMVIGIIVVILIVLVLIFYAGPRIINVNVNQRSFLDALPLFL